LARLNLLIAPDSSLDAGGSRRRIYRLKGRKLDALRQVPLDGREECLNTKAKALS